jgi:hypothetical protein
VSVSQLIFLVGILGMGRCPKYNHDDGLKLMIGEYLCISTFVVPIYFTLNLYS